MRRLRHLADHFADVASDDYEDLAQLCRALAIRRLDVRFMVLMECFRLSASFWSGGEGTGVDNATVAALCSIWRSYLAAIVEQEDQPVAVQLAESLKDELEVLAAAA